MRLLQRNAKVTTRFGGGFVQSIDGLAGGRDGGAPGRLVLLRQRHRGAQGRGGDAGRTTATASGGTATTGAATQRRPGGRRLVPRAVRARHRAASACRCASSAPTRRPPPCTAVAAAPDPPRPRRRHRAACAPRASVETLRVLVGPVGARCADDAAVGLLERGPGGQRRLRAARPAAAARSRCSTPAGARAPDARRGHRPGRRHARRGDEQPVVGASPAPTTRASRAAVAAFDEGDARGQVRRRRRGRRRGRPARPARGAPRP